MAPLLPPLRVLPKLASPALGGAGNTVNTIPLQLSRAPDLLGNRAALRRAEKAGHFPGTHGFVLPLSAKNTPGTTCPERRQEGIQILEPNTLWQPNIPKFPSSWMQFLRCGAPTGYASPLASCRLLPLPRKEAKMSCTRSGAAPKPRVPAAEAVFLLA